MGVDGKTQVGMVSCSTQDSESTQNSLIGRLTGVPVNIDGVHNVEDFEVIEIVDDSQPYPDTDGTGMGF
jgi:hypothetical protein